MQDGAEAQELGSLGEGCGNVGIGVAATLATPEPRCRPPVTGLFSIWTKGTASAAIQHHHLEHHPYRDPRRAHRRGGLAAFGPAVAGLVGSGARTDLDVRALVDADPAADAGPAVRNMVQGRSRRSVRPSRTDRCRGGGALRVGFSQGTDSSRKTWSKALLVEASRRGTRQQR